MGQGEPFSLEDFLQEANGKRAKIADIKASALLKTELKPDSLYQPFTIRLGVYS